MSFRSLFFICRTTKVRFSFFFFNDTATTEIYTLSLHDALPIYQRRHGDGLGPGPGHLGPAARRDRKSTRLNSSHGYISYAVFCLKKKINIFGKIKVNHHAYIWLVDPHTARVPSHHPTTSVLNAF